MPLTPETVRAVARLLHETDLSEIEIETTSPHDSDAAGETSAANARVRLQMRRGSSPVAPRRAAPLAALSQPTATASPTPAPSPTVITSPAVGVFRQSKTALQEGDAVKTGQVVGHVEALKIPTDVLSSATGRISRLLVEEGQGVEYDQALFEIESVTENAATSA